jgi:hypothetical protein
MQVDLGPEHDPTVALGDGLSEAPVPQKMLVISGPAPSIDILNTVIQRLTETLSLGPDVHIEAMDLVRTPCFT